MIDQINKLIAINLFLLFASENDSLNLKDFKNENGSQLPGAKMLAEVMQQKELIRPKADEEFSFQLTELGKYIAESGGWLVYLEKLKKLKISTNNRFKKENAKNNKLNSELAIVGLIIIVLGILIMSCL